MPVKELILTESGLWEAVTWSMRLSMARLLSTSDLWMEKKDKSSRMKRQTETGLSCFPF